MSTNLQGHYKNCDTARGSGNTFVLQEASAVYSEFPSQSSSLTSSLGNYDQKDDNIFFPASSSNPVATEGRVRIQYSYWLDPVIAEHSHTTDSTPINVELAIFSDRRNVTGIQSFSLPDALVRSNQSSSSPASSSQGSLFENCLAGPHRLTCGPGGPDANDTYYGALQTPPITPPLASGSPFMAMITISHAQTNEPLGCWSIYSTTSPTHPAPSNMPFYAYIGICTLILGAFFCAAEWWMKRYFRRKQESLAIDAELETLATSGERWSSRDSMVKIPPSS